ncbi:TetR/AcrR family transcriptional regulator C-terminal domain-containing protein [Anaerolentibacter hominis]|uniref:TetR/AcrR family transcriptional regulator C-terminal domain-containing protein n=1 Tax=Anaerolentibacter hominis TaxID=3079009 RepID=UPI0031B7F5C9
MSDSLITKKAIAEGLKKLTAQKNFARITVSDITNICGLNRQTFYYHFQDKFELLNWIYYNEGFCNVIDGINLDNWDQKVLGLLRQMRVEQGFYSNTIKNEGECFQDYLWNICRTLFQEAMEKLDVHHVVPEEDKLSYAGFFAYGICGVIMDWVKRGMKEEPEKIAGQLKKLARNCEKFAYERYLEENELL